MKPVIIIAIAFVLLIPVNVFAIDPNDLVQGDLYFGSLTKYLPPDSSYEKSWVVGAPFSFPVQDAEKYVNSGLADQVVQEIFVSDISGKNSILIGILVIVVVVIGGYFLLSPGTTEDMGSQPEIQSEIQPGPSLEPSPNRISESSSEATSTPEPTPEPTQVTEQEPSQEPKQSSCISNPNPVFTADITDLTKISRITPPGSVNPGDGFVTAHSYIWIEGSGVVPIYAPVDMTLGMGGLYTESGNPAQYILFFGVSCEVSIKLDHIDNPIEQIKNVLPKTPKTNDSRTDDVSSVIGFKAGDLLGYTGGTGEEHNWDFGVYNETKPNFLLDGEQYEDGTADCPYDYFTEDKKTVYYNLFVSGKGYGPPPTTFCKGD